MCHKEDTCGELSISLYRCIGTCVCAHNVCFTFTDLFISGMKAWNYMSNFKVPNHHGQFFFSCVHACHSQYNIITQIHFSLKWESSHYILISFPVNLLIISLCQGKSLQGQVNHKKEVNIFLVLIYLNWT